MRTARARGLDLEGVNSFGKDPTRRRKKKADGREVAGVGRRSRLGGGREGWDRNPLFHSSPRLPPLSAWPGAGAAERHKRPSALP